MLVGSKTINMEDLYSHTKSVADLESYAVKLVPKYLRHHDCIIMNQKYLVALHLRKIESIPYKQRKELSERLLDGVHLTGIPNRLYDIRDLVSITDVDKLMRFIEENSNDKGREV